MAFIGVDDWFSGRARDGTWVLRAMEHEFNGLSVVLPVNRYGDAPLKVGRLVRMQFEEPDRTKVLWRVVALVPGSSGPAAVIVPSDIPANVPAASVDRVELASKGKPDASRPGHGAAHQDQCIVTG